MILNSYVMIYFMIHLIQSLGFRVLGVRVYDFLANYWAFTGTLAYAYKGFGIHPIVAKAKSIFHYHTILGINF